MDTFQQTIANVTGGDFIGKIIVAIIILVIVGFISHFVVRWLRHIMGSDSNPLPQSSIFVNITPRHYLGHWYLLGAGCLL